MGRSRRQRRGYPHRLPLPLCRNDRYRPSRTMAGFLLAGTLVGIGYGFSMPTLQALAVRHVPAGEAGSGDRYVLCVLRPGHRHGCDGLGFRGCGIRVPDMYFSTLIPLALAAAVYYLFKQGSPGSLRAI